MSVNKLKGPIPDGLSKLTHLEELNLMGNALKGRIPEWISVLTSLTKLELTDNRLTGNAAMLYNYLIKAVRALNEPGIFTSS